MNDTYDNAKRKMQECPAEFNELLDWVKVKAAAEPIQYQVARAKAEAEAKNKKSANDSISGRRPPIELSPSSDDPDDNPGAALVSTE